MKLQTEVLIIGGGATGVGIARDLSLRGILSLHQIALKLPKSPDILSFFFSSSSTSYSS